MNGIISWFARNGVAANLLMVFIIGMGLYALKTRIPLEVFPSFELDVVNINVPFRGATPAEVEEGVTIKIEEAIYDLEGIKELRSIAAEGMGSVSVEVEKGYNSREMMEDIKVRLDTISTFPVDIERPSLSIPQHRREVISVVVSGKVSERELRQLGEKIRDSLVAIPGISQAELAAVRPYEISIEVSEQTLKQFGLTLAAVADAVKNRSMDLPAGSIKTLGGELLIRTKGQAYDKVDFENIVILTQNDGTRLSLKDIARVNDGFEEEPVEARFNNEKAVLIEIYSVGNQNAIIIANLVKKYISETAQTLPSGIKLSYWRDRSRIINARLNTLTNSAIFGGALVLLLLTIFLRWSVAFWVFVGIPISFMGGIALMPQLGVTVNIISLFAFILVLGIVVDDAIVTGENIFNHLRKSDNATDAVIAGTQEVAVPVTFGILTTVAAFVPLLMIDGVRGQLFAQIPLIVIPVLLFSLVESKLILPAHLKHLRIKADKDESHNRFVRFQRSIANALETYIIKIYQPALLVAMRQRYITWAIFIAIATVIFSYAYSGHIRFVFFPRVQSETAKAILTMPAGTPFEKTASHIKHMTWAAEQLRDEFVDPNTGRSVIKNILATSGYSGRIKFNGRSHVGRVMFEIEPPEERTIDITSSQLVQKWRRKIGKIPGAKELNFRAEIGRAGNPIELQFTGAEFEILRKIADRTKTYLADFPGVFDISDNFELGKEEIQLQIKPEAELLGITLSDLASQVRQAFYGFEIQRIQRGREDVRVIVRYPVTERRSLENLKSMRIRNRDGTEVPFSEVAIASTDFSFSVINRNNRYRTLTVSADVNKKTANVEAIKESLSGYTSELIKAYPGVRFYYGGEVKEQGETVGSLIWGLIFVLFAIYTLLAIPFKSYLQPLMVMSVIPFGAVGAILGHIIMGMNLSIISFMGMLALTGVVVNDSLVLVDYINRRRREGIALIDAVNKAGIARFRPILLTSLTTFAGLMPLIFEKTTQAQFLIPMAISLGFGVLFATFITLLLVPISYLILEDVIALVKGSWRKIIGSSLRAKGTG